MRIRPLRSSALVASALALTTVAFAPAPEPAATTAATGAVAAATVVDGQPVTTVRGLTQRTGFLPGEDAHDLLSWVRASRRIVEAAGLRTIAATDGCAPLSVTDAGPTTACEEPEPGDGMGEEEFTFSYLDTAGDLDGDGWQDTLEVSVTFGPESYSETVSARSGRDGTGLWIQEPASGDDGFSYLAPAPDIDGDGAEDLLRITYAFEGEGGGSCSPLRCEFHDAWSMTLTALRGATGEELGSTSRDVAIAYEDGSTSAGAIVAGAGVFDWSLQLEGVLTGLDFVDVDGDGAHGLLLGTLDLSAEGAGLFAGAEADGGHDDAVLGRQTVEAASEVELLDMTTGQAAQVAAADNAALYPVGVTLDGRDAVVVDRFPAGAAEELYGCAFSDTGGVHECGSSADLAGEEREGPTRTLLDGDLEAVWTAPADPHSVVVFEAGGDLDGDGADDLLDVVIDVDAFELATAAVSGASGAALWTAPVAGGVVDDGDLLGVTFAFDWADDPDGYQETITATGHRVDGATGEALATAELGSVDVFERDGQFQDGWLSVSVAQVDGEGVDLLTAAQTVLLEETHREEECYEETDPETGETYEWCEGHVEYGVVDQSGSVRGSDGATLAQLFSRDLGTAWFSGALDVDRDGLDDLLVEEFDLDTFELATTAQRTDGTPIWTLDAAYVVTVLATPDGWSLVTFDTTEGATVVRDAVDLTERWRIEGAGGGFVVLLPAVEVVALS